MSPRFEEPESGPVGITLGYEIVIRFRPEALEIARRFLDALDFPAEEAPFVQYADLVRITPTSEERQGIATKARLDQQAGRD